MTSKVIYKGDLETECIHLNSSDSIRTDAPVDNKGKGSAFSPTDLCATSLATCMLTVMGIWTRDNDVSIDGAYADVTKHMGVDPRRITKIEVVLHMPANDYNPKVRSILQHIADTCPVAKSLHPDIIQDITFQW